MPLVREAWLAGVQPHHIKNGAKHTGIFPWNPAEVMDDMCLFRNVQAAEVDTNFQEARSAAILKLPEACQKRTVKCGACRLAIQVDARFCMHCGTQNAQFSELAAIVSHPGARPGWKQSDHTGFNLDQLVDDHFQGVRAVSEAGKQLVDDWDLRRRLQETLGGTASPAS